MVKDYIDLASDRLRGHVLAVSSEIDGSARRLLQSSCPSALFEGNKRLQETSDAWSTRRRSSGHEWVIVRLGVPGLVRELVIGTRGVGTDCPGFASVEGCVAPHGALPDELDGWVELLPKSTIKGDCQNRFDVLSRQRFTHLRLNVYPDGAVSRFRVLGEALPDWAATGRAFPPYLDLAAGRNGGLVVSSSATAIGKASHLNAPDSALSGQDGWVTERRREPGCDEAAIRLAARGRIRMAVVDTHHLTDHAAPAMSLDAATGWEQPEEGDWFEILPVQRLLPDTEHIFDSGFHEHDDVRWVRLKLHPDGGVSRLRLWGEVSPGGVLESRLLYLSACGEPELHGIFMAVCHSVKFANELCDMAPFESVADLQRKGATAWSRCREKDWKESLAGHPRIGQKASGNDLASRWSRGEQSKAATPDEAVKAELAARQAEYEEKFGFIFLICASGRSSGEILAALNERMEQAPERELQTVAEELAKIIHLRLEKLLES